jgi:histidine triad (HIT) family protein
MANAGSGEEQAAHEAAAAGGEQAQEITVFDKIVRGDIPSEVVYSDEKTLAFRDINPVAPTHVVVIPKNRGKLSRLVHASEEDEAVLGRLMRVAANVARQEGLGDDGYRVVANDGEHGCQVRYNSLSCRYS